jgi:hypothetical protein
MRLVWRGPSCSGCNRTSALTPAPDTPNGQELDNLYCDGCHAKGISVYRPWVEPSRVNKILGGILGLVFVVFLTCGFLGFCKAMHGH